MPNSTICRTAVGFLVIVALAVTIWFAVAQAGPTPTPTATPTATPAGAMAAGGGPTDPPVNSSYFPEAGMRCGTPDPPSPIVSPLTTSDCGTNFTNPLLIYDPGDTYQIPVVVHIIDHSDGRGQISNALVFSQIAVLNEDFLALAGPPGVPVEIQFVLVGITRPCEGTTGSEREKCDAWFLDTLPNPLAPDCDYCEELNWDPNNYLNIYTTNGGGGATLGFAGAFPPTFQDNVGSDDDRVVIRWDVFGRPGLAGAAWQGRIGTHEVGHYLGLYHVFGEDDGQCEEADPPLCYSDWDTICDTPPQDFPTSGCQILNSCDPSDNRENYMDYSDDTCMETFTVEQRRRMRCVYENWRFNLPEPGLLLQLASGLLGLIVLDKRRRRANG